MGPCRADQGRRLPPSSPPLARARRGGRNDALGGGATHDIGFERDQRNNGITHKIDPDVDLEREYVEATLTRTGIVTEFAYTTPKDAMKEAKTATGGTFQSDGRVLVLKLGESPPLPQLR